MMSLDQFLKWKVKKNSNWNYDDYRKWAKQKDSHKIDIKLMLLILLAFSLAFGLTELGC